MVSTKPEKEMEEVIKKGEEEHNLLSEVERLLKDLLKYKDLLIKTTEGMDKRLLELENRTTGGIPKDTSVQIEKIEETIERLSKQISKAKPDESKLAEEITKMKETMAKMDKGMESVEEISGNLDILSKSLGEIEKKLDDFSKMAHNTEEKSLELIKPLEKSIEEISKSQKEDNKFIEGMYIEVKDHINDTDTKLREMSKEITKSRQESEQTNKFRKALQEFIKTVME